MHDGMPYGRNQRSRSLKGSRPSVPHGTNFFYLIVIIIYHVVLIAFNINHSSILPLMALNSLYCADVPLSNYSLTHSRLRGLGVARGRISRFPIDLRRRPYNTLALPCECVINLIHKTSYLKLMNFLNF